MTYDLDNKMFQLALDLVNKSSRNIFLTGKAGTGKTTFLRYIREKSPKQMAIVAPTGVAAINAGGVTIHSFFQLSFAPFLPESKKFSKNEETIDRQGLLSRLRLNKERLKVLQQLELLIIDEVSMVRCDTMDAIDTILRHVRNRHLERFGGVQVLFIGDMFQLPPVIKDQEWRLLSEHYSGPYFFNSDVIREEPPVYIEFTKIYRQSEEQFIRVLNQVRNNEMDEDGMNILESRFQPGFHRSKQDGYIVLTTHNEKAREINLRELNNLDITATPYKAEIKDDFPENAYPADEIIYLKPGAQVMFLKNDSDKAKRFFNGKIGTVKRLENDKIIIQTRDDDQEVEVTRETWKNIRYTVNKSSRGMEEEELGSFTQFPLRLAWAITIHKSQGLTFEKAIIDAGDAFAAGQVYVALSRCTNLEGMILQSRIRRSSLHSDSRIIEFSQNCILPDALEDELAIARKNYQLDILINTFDFSASVQEARELKEYVQKHESSFNDAVSWASELFEKLNTIQSTGVKFHNWLRSQGQQPVSLEENSLMQTKVRDGANHFTKELQAVLDMLYKSPVVTDSRQHAKEFNDSSKEVFAELALKLYLLKGIDLKFDPESWHEKKRNFVLPSFSINAYAGTAPRRTQSDHPALYDKLRKLRDAICSKKDMPIYLIASSKTIDEMVSYLPQTEDELEQIIGFGRVKVEKYGQQFLEIITQYSQENGLSSRITDKKTSAKVKKDKKEKIEKPDKGEKVKDAVVEKADTKTISFNLFKEGNSIPDIAKTRGFTIGTIEGHLIHFIKEGDLHIGEVMSPEKLSLIEPALKDHGETSITPVKERLGDDISYGEIRMVLAWQAFQGKERQ